MKVANPGFPSTTCSPCRCQGCCKANAFLQLWTCLVILLGMLYTLLLGPGHPAHFGLDHTRRISGRHTERPTMWDGGTSAMCTRRMQVS